MQFYVKTETGQDITRSVYEVLREAYLQPYTTRSDFARANPEAIGCAAEMGLLTLYTDRATIGNVWRLTLQGVNFMHRLFEQIRCNDEE